MKQVIRISLIVSCFFAIAATRQTHGQTVFEQMVTPGELIEKHADLEKTCNSCHEPFAKSSQPQLCLKCHDKVAADQRTKTGFHGRHVEASVASCKQCHTDHMGRAAVIAPLDKTAFDHDLTDFVLKGKHVTTTCESCHATRAKFRDAPGRCIDCHRKDDRHKGALGEACASCHTESDWKQVLAFDHGRTRFPLEGAHTKVACASCHAGERYKGVPTACIGCHKKDDVHKGRLGAKCESCHGPASWKNAKFNHDKDTKFPLRGAHVSLTCEACHKGARAKTPPTACIGCHRGDDVHRGQLGPDCQSCHSETAWRGTAKFDHDKTRFPLVGLHGDVACKACHKGSSYKDVSGTCASCHQDQFHQGRLGSACATCHTAQGWPLFHFDHDTQTAYPLTGAHRQLDCHACHATTAPDSLKLPTACVACHAGDDVHDGAFGRRCERCHTTKAFRGAGKILQ